MAISNNNIFNQFSRLPVTVRDSGQRFGVVPGANQFPGASSPVDHIDEQVNLRQPILTDVQHTGPENVPRRDQFLSQYDDDSLEIPAEQSVEKSLALHKAQSVIKQIMRAISNHGGGPTEGIANQQASDIDFSALGNFNIDFEFQSSEAFSLEQSIATSGTHGDFSLDLAYQASQSINLTLSDPDTGFELNLSVSREVSFSLSAEGQFALDESGRGNQGGPAALNFSALDLAFDFSKAIDFELKIPDRDLFDDVNRVKTAVDDLAQLNSNDDQKLNNKLFDQLLLLSLQN